MLLVTFQTRCRSRAIFGSSSFNLCHLKSTAVSKDLAKFCYKSVLLNSVFSSVCISLFPTFHTLYARPTIHGVDICSSFVSPSAAVSKKVLRAFLR